MSLKHIQIDIISHDKQRYNTVGDWFFDNEEEPDTLYIKVSDLENDASNFAIAVHEGVEAIRCNRMSVTEQSVTDFDKSFTGEGEPGDDLAAPYYEAHKEATIVEKVVCEALNVDWDSYNKSIEEL